MDASKNEATPILTKMGQVSINQHEILPHCHYTVDPISPPPSFLPTPDYMGNICKDIILSSDKYL